MFCEKCGANNIDNANHCANCGAPMANDQTAAAQQPAYQQPTYQQPAQQPIYQQPVINPAPVIPGKGLGIAAMVLGIISLVIFCFYFISIPCSIIGLVLGGVSASKAKAAGSKNSCAVAGIACSSIALALTILFIVIAVVFSSAVIGGVYNTGDFYF